MSLADAIGLAGAILFLLRLLPQPVRLWRHGVPDGVSPQSVAQWNKVGTNARFAAGTTVYVHVPQKAKARAAAKPMRAASKPSKAAARKR